MKTPKINYIYGDKGMLDEIKPLWEALNEHHRQHSQNFKKHYSEMTFEKRKPDLLTKVARIKMRVDLAVDAATGQNVGYCVSSFDKEKTGEIESIFVNVVYRGLGIGDSLMKKALSWMEVEGAVAKIVEVGAGNEQVFGFYAKYGFFATKNNTKTNKNDT